MWGHRSNAKSATTAKLIGGSELRDTTKKKRTLLAMGTKLSSLTAMALARVEIAIAAVARLKLGGDGKLRLDFAEEEVDNIFEAWENAVKQAPVTNEWSGANAKAIKNAAREHPLDDTKPKETLLARQQNLKIRLLQRRLHDDDDDESESESEDEENPDEAAPAGPAAGARDVGAAEVAELTTYRWHLVIHLTARVGRDLCSIPADREVARFIERWCEASEEEDPDEASEELRTPGRFWAGLREHLKASLQTQAARHQTAQQLAEQYKQYSHRHDWENEKGRAEALLLLRDLCVELQEAVTRDYNARQENHVEPMLKFPARIPNMPLVHYKAMKERFEAEQIKTRKAAQQRRIDMGVVQALLEHEVVTIDDLAILAGTGLCVEELTLSKDTARTKRLYKLRPRPFRIILQPGWLPYKYTQWKSSPDETAAQKEKREEAEAEVRSADYQTNVRNAIAQLGMIHKRARQTPKTGASGHGPTNTGRTKNKTNDRGSRRKGKTGGRGGRANKNNRRSGGEKRSRDPEPEKPRKQQDTNGRRTQSQAVQSSSSAESKQTSNSKGTSDNRPTWGDNSRRHITPAWKTKQKQKEWDTNKAAPTWATRHKAFAAMIHEPWQPLNNSGQYCDNCDRTSHSTEECESRVWGRHC